MEEITAEKLKEVHPVLADRITKLYEECDRHNLPIRVTTGLRTHEEQNALFDQGRAIPGHIVTDAKGGYSAHQFGYAVDIVPGKENMPAFTPDWNAQDMEWKVVLNFAISLNLAEGAQWRAFPDRPHLYLSELPPTPTDEMRAAYDSGGMPAVWKHFADEYKVPYEETA